MADEEILINGKPIHELRVVDLKKECDKNKLPKNGSKKELVERLRAVRKFTLGIFFDHIFLASNFFRISSEL